MERTLFAFPMNQSREHTMGHWRYLLLNGRIKKAARENPTREQLNVKHALEKLGIRYRMAVMFRNPYFSGWTNDVPRAPQWLDFCIYKNNKMFVLLFEGTSVRGRNKGGEPRRRLEQQLATKKQFLLEKGTPFLCISRRYTTQEYEVVIGSYLRRYRKEQQEHESKTARANEQATSGGDEATNHQRDAGNPSVR